MILSKHVLPISDLIFFLSRDNHSLTFVISIFYVSAFLFSPHIYVFIVAPGYLYIYVKASYLGCPNVHVIHLNNFQYNGSKIYLY